MELDLIFLNDVHGYLELHPELFYKGNTEIIEQVGGYARIAALVKKIREQNPYSLFFDGGDTFHGTLPVVQTKGEILLPVLNKLPVSAMVGHWDFGYGPQQLKHLLSQLNYPMLGINVYHNDGRLFLTPYLLIEMEHLKVGVIGICSNIIDKTMPAHFSEGLTITNGLKELPQYVDELRSHGADLIILLSHNGFPQDVFMLENTTGIDVCLSAHTHNRLYESVRVKDSLVIQCGCHGSFLGHLKLQLEQKKIKQHSYKLIKVTEDVVPDAEMEKVIEPLLQPFDFYKNKVVGNASSILHRYNTLNSSMDHLLLSAIRYVSQSAIAFSNGWRYGIPIDAGKITEWDLYNMVPMNPPVSTVELTGQEITDMLEQNLERTFSTEPMNQMGGYVKRCAGLRVHLRIENGKGYRIQEIYLGDQHIKADQSYKVGFVTAQGVPVNLGKNRVDLDVKAVPAMIDFLAAHPDFNFEDYQTFYLV